MPIEPLPNNPSTEHLRKQAKRLQRAIRDRDATAVALVRELHPRADTALAAFALHDAQLVIARRHGFASWPALVAHLEAIAPLTCDPVAAHRADASPVDAWTRLAVLDYGSWRPSHLDRARAALARDPTLGRGDLFAAAAAGDVDAVRGLLAGDRSLATTPGGPFHWPPLLYACYSRLVLPGHSTLDVARVLLDAGADPNAGFLWCGNVPPFTALTGAFGEGEDGNTQPPHHERDRLARMLLDAGADPNDGQALYNRHFREADDHLELLFEYGLGRDRGGPWLRQFADRMGDHRALLVEELWCAARLGYARRVRLLVEHGVDVDTPGRRDARTAYEVAVMFGRSEIADYLVAHGARATPISVAETLAAACVSGRRDDVNRLLAQHPDLLDRLAPAARAELVWRASKARQLDGLRLLHDLGFSLDAHHLGRTPLHEAAWAGDLDVAKLLVELGADVHALDTSYHAPPIGWAAHNHQRLLVELLLPFATIFETLRCDSIERARALLRDDPALAIARDRDGDSLAFYLHDDLADVDAWLELLRAAGVDFAARDHRGRTVLDAAHARGQLRVVDALRAHALA